MIVKVDDSLIVDIDKVSLCYKPNNLIIVEGFGVSISPKDFEIINKAFIWQHKTHMYNKELKREGGK